MLGQLDGGLAAELHKAAFRFFGLDDVVDALGVQRVKVCLLYTSDEAERDAAWRAIEAACPGVELTSSLPRNMDASNKNHNRGTSHGRTECEDIARSGSP